VREVAEVREESGGIYKRARVGVGGDDDDEN